MPIKHRSRYRGRHCAPRRHFLSPIVLTGLMVSSTAAVGLPETANAFEIPAATGSAVSMSGSTEQGTVSDRAERLSRASTTDRAADVSTMRVVHGIKLKRKPPPWVLPVNGYHLTARFGATGLWSHAHTGLDFAAPEGTQIRSIAPGTVVSSAYDGAYGNKTVIRLDDGTVLWYCHQSGVEVSSGERVAAGQLIGYVGSTGHVTGPHLHLEVHPGNGGPSDPEPWLAEHHLNP